MFNRFTIAVKIDVLCIFSHSKILQLFSRINTDRYISFAILIRDYFEHITMIVWLVTTIPAT